MAISSFFYWIYIILLTKDLTNYCIIYSIEYDSYCLCLFILLFDEIIEFNRVDFKLAKESNHKFYNHSLDSLNLFVGVELRIFAAFKYLQLKFIISGSNFRNVSVIQSVLVSHRFTAGSACSPARTDQFYFSIFHIAATQSQRVDTKKKKTLAANQSACRYQILISHTPPSPFSCMGYRHNLIVKLPIS